MGRCSTREPNSNPQWCPATAGRYYLMLNGGSPCGMEILALAALFGLQRHVQQYSRLFFGVSGVKNGTSGHQQVGTCFDHGGDGFVSNAPIDLDSVFSGQVPPASSTSCADLVQGERDELLAAKARIHAHHEHVVNHGQDFDQHIDPGRRIDHHGGFHPVLFN